MKFDENFECFKSNSILSTKPVLKPTKKALSGTINLSFATLGLKIGRKMTP